MLKFAARKLITTAACLAALSSMSVLSSQALAAEKVYKLKMAETWGANFPIFGDASKNMAKMA